MHDFVQRWYEGAKYSEVAEEFSRLRESGEDIDIVSYGILKVRRNGTLLQVTHGCCVLNGKQVTLDKALTEAK